MCTRVSQSWLAASQQPSSWASFVELDLDADKRDVPSQAAQQRLIDKYNFRVRSLKVQCRRQGVDVDAAAFASLFSGLAGSLRSLSVGSVTRLPQLPLLEHLSVDSAGDDGSALLGVLKNLPALTLLDVKAWALPPDTSALPSSITRIRVLGTVPCNAAPVARLLGCKNWDGHIDQLLLSLRSTVPVSQLKQAQRPVSVTQVLWNMDAEMEYHFDSFRAVLSAFVGLQGLQASLLLSCLLGFSPSLPSVTCMIYLCRSSFGCNHVSLVCVTGDRDAQAERPPVGGARRRCHDRHFRSAEEGWSANHSPAHEGLFVSLLHANCLTPPYWRCFCRCI